MHYPRVHILTTRELEPELISKAAGTGIEIDLLPLISTELLHTVPLKEEVARLAMQAGAVIFTSLNAAKAVTALLKREPDWRIFTIGTATRDFISNTFGAGTIAGVADSASGLADLIVPAGVKKAVYFCGNLRREELPEKLLRAGIELEEVVVYNTTYTLKEATQQYDGILFFSPGAADSFFHANRIDPATVLFAIGNTTAGALRTYTPNNIVVSSVPSATALLEKAIDYFANYNLYDRTQK